MKRTLLALLFLPLATVVSDPGSAQPGEPLAAGKPASSPPTRTTTVTRAGPTTGTFLSLNEAIRIGLAQHPLLEQSRQTSLAAKAITKQIRGDLFPWLEASVAETSGSLRVTTADGKTIHDRGGQGFFPGAALPHHNQNMVTGGLLLNQLLTDFGYTAHRILARLATESATEKEILTNKALVILNVQKAYFGSLAQQRLVEIAGETLKLRETIRDQVRTLYKNQLKSKLDLDLIQVEVANAELALIKARNDLTQQFAALSHAMGVAGSEHYELEKIPVSVVPAPSPDVLVEAGLKDRPELLGAQERLQATEELLKAAKALDFGSVTAVGIIGVTKYWDSHDNGIRDNEVDPIWGVGATARLPLFTGFRIQNQVVEARHHKEEAKEDLQNLANEVILQVMRAYLAQTTNAEQIPLEQERVSFAKEALSLGQERYRLGLSSIIEVVRATTALFEAESRLAEAQFIYKTSEAAVAYATGQEHKRY